MSEYKDPVKRERVTDAIRDVNSQIEGLAREFDIPLVDIFSFSKAIFGENSDVKDPVTYATFSLAARVAAIAARRATGRTNRLKTARTVAKIFRMLFAA